MPTYPSDSPRQSQKTTSGCPIINTSGKKKELEIKILQNVETYMKGLRENVLKKKKKKEKVASLLQFKVAIFEDFCVPLIFPSAARWESVHEGSDLYLHRR